MFRVTNLKDPWVCPEILEYREFRVHRVRLVCLVPRELLEFKVNLS
jgi:hypothetical protein